VRSKNQLATLLLATIFLSFLSGISIEYAVAGHMGGGMGGGGAEAWWNRQYHNRSSMGGPFKDP